MTVVALLVASVSALGGVCTGAFLTHRLMRGLPPIPTIRKARKLEDDNPATNDKPRAHPPLTRA